MSTANPSGPAGPAGRESPGGVALRAAARDLRWLLCRGYPREAALAWVGDRHGLIRADREALRRGVAAPAAARARARRRLALAALAGRVVGVDGHNLLITLETALRGERLLLADDGWVRDTARLGRHHAPGPVTWRAAALLVSSLAGAGAAGALILLDAPLPRSGELAAGLRDLLARAGLPGEARAVAVPERELVVHPGPVASGDSALIDRVALPVDLAGEIIGRLDPPPAVERLK